MSQEKTEQPTSKKLREARKRGEVAVSRDLIAGVTLLIFVGAALAAGPLIAERLAGAARGSFEKAASAEFSNAMLLDQVRQAVMPVAWVLTPLLLAVMVVGALVAFVQIGPVFTATTLIPALDRLNPAAGLKRMFFSLNTYVELLKILTKAGVIGWLCWVAVEPRLRDMLLCGELPPERIALLTAAILRKLAWSVVTVLLGLGAIDLVWQRWQFIRRQRMTKEEIRREYEADEGKPEHRFARRQLHRQIATEAMLQDVPDADVIVVNPTHIACALRFDPEKENAPRLLAKGKGAIAEKIREIATREGVCIRQNIPLAWTLYRLDLHATIPPELYEAVKHVLLWVEEVAHARGQTPRWSAPQPSDDSAPLAL